MHKLHWSRHGQHRGYDIILMIWLGCNPSLAVIEPIHRYCADLFPMFLGNSIWFSVNLLNKQWCLDAVWWYFKVFSSFRRPSSMSIKSTSVPLMSRNSSCWLLLINSANVSLSTLRILINNNFFTSFTISIFGTAINLSTRKLQHFCSANASNRSSSPSIVMFRIFAPYLANMIWWNELIDCRCFSNNHRAKLMR